MTADAPADPRWHRVGRTVFGDRRGLLVWLVLLAVLGFLWRLTLGLTDSNVLANVLVAMAEGNLAVAELRFPLDAIGEQHVQQGLRDVGGTYYGRNYGQVALAVPVLWILRGFSVLADVRVLLAGAWSLAVVAAIQQAGVVSGRSDAGRFAGALAGLGLFGASLAVGTDVDVRLLPVIALQVVNLGATAFVGVLVYRLLGTFQGDRVALSAGLAAGLATPVAFWATFPKRHVVVTVFVLVGILCFAKSRTGHSRPTLLRAGAYAAMGVVAWIHAFEGFFLVLTLGAVDLTTVDTSRRELAMIAGALLLALAPTFLTNVLISGNPLIPPRIVGSGAEDSLVDAGGVVSNAAMAGIATGGIVLSIVPASVLEIVDQILGAVLGGLAALTEPDRLRHVFLRSGNYAEFTSESAGYEPAELSMAEGMPLLGGLVVLPWAVRKRFRAIEVRRRPSLPRSLAPVRQTDLLVGALAVVFTIIYLGRLPLHSQLTVRYLFPVFVFGLYGLARIGPVRRALEDDPGAAGSSYVLTVVVTLLLAMVALAALDPARAEAVQAHALVHLAAGTVLAVTIVGGTFWPGRVSSRYVALALGTTAGVTTGYYLLAGLEYFTDGAYALDLARVLAEFVSIL